MRFERRRWGRLVTTAPVVPAPTVRYGGVSRKTAQEHVPADVTRPVTRRELLPCRQGDPRRLGRFHITARIPGGNHDTVKFLAWDAREQPYVLKVLLRADPTIQWRMQREARAARRVRSPRVARVLGYFEEGGYSYTVQRFAEGPPLRDVLRTRPGCRLPEPDLWRVALGLAQALADVRDAGLVHADPTPMNVVVTERRLVLVDLGASRTLGEVRSEMYGTPYYLSPEQLRRVEVVPASDVFIWGLTVAESGLGRRPWDRPGRPPLSAELYGDAVLGEAPDLGDLPPALADVVSLALQQDPDDRPTVHDLVAMLEQQGETTHSFTPFTRSFERTPASAARQEPLVPLMPTWSEMGRYHYWAPLLSDAFSEAVYRLGTRWRVVAWLAVAALVLGCATGAVLRSLLLTTGA